MDTYFNLVEKIANCSPFVCVCVYTKGLISGHNSKDTDNGLTKKLKRQKNNDRCNITKLMIEQYELH